MYKWWKVVKLREEAEQMPSGTIIVKEDKKTQGGAAIYARVSCRDTKKTLRHNSGSFGV